MKRMLLLFFIIPIFSFSQCPPDSTFSSQAEIDALAIDFPSCTILGDLIIEGDDIIDLSGLNQITGVRDIRIRNNPLLLTLNGLNPNLEIYNAYVINNGLRIDNNAILNDLSGLSGLTNLSMVESVFSITSNPMLTSLNGIPNTFNGLTTLNIASNVSLVSLEGLENYDSGYYLGISGNDNLLDLTGLGTVSNINSLYVSDNISLQSFNGANFDNCSFDTIRIENHPNLTNIISGFSENNFGGLSNNLTIKDNPNLSVCNVQVICLKLNGVDYTSGMMFFDIHNNATGCNSIQEIEYACSVPPSNDECDYAFYYDDIIANNYPMWLELGQTVSAFDEFATESSEAPSCNDVDVRKDLWFLFNSGENTTIDIVADVGYSLQLWEGGCADLVVDETACDGNILSDIPVTTNTYYTVQVWIDTSGRVNSGSPGFNIMVQDGLLSTPEIINNNNIKIYPNPVQNEFFIESNQEIDNIEIFNLLGQQVMVSNMKTLDVSDLTEGLYLVKVFSNGKTSTYKIVKN